MSAELDYNYTPAETLQEANDDVAQVLAIARRVVCQAHAFNAASRDPAKRAGVLERLDGFLIIAADAHGFLENLDGQSPIGGNAS